MGRPTTCKGRERVRVRAVEKAKARQAVREAISNPACRVYREDKDNPDREIDIEFNRQARKFEKLTSWQS